jgi:hypothetical protein
MHRKMARQIVRVDLRESGPPDDAGIVDHDIDASELLDGSVNERLGARRGGDIVGVGNCDPSRTNDLGGHGGRRLGIRAETFYRSAEVVHDNPRAPFGEQQRIGAPDAASSASDDRGAPFEAELIQAATGF